MTTRTMTDLEHKLTAALWRLAMDVDPIDSDYGGGERCRCVICGAELRSWDDDQVKKHLVQHAPGCALFGLDPALLAGLDEFDQVTP